MRVLRLAGARHGRLRRGGRRRHLLLLLLVVVVLLLVVGGFGLRGRDAGHAQQRRPRAQAAAELRAVALGARRGWRDGAVRVRNVCGTEGVGVRWRWRWRWRCLDGAVTGRLQAGLCTCRPRPSGVR